MEDCRWKSLDGSLELLAGVNKICFRFFEINNNEIGVVVWNEI